MRSSALAILATSILAGQRARGGSGPMRTLGRSVLATTALLPPDSRLPTPGSRLPAPDSLDSQTPTPPVLESDFASSQRYGSGSNARRRRDPPSVPGIAGEPDFSRF